MIPTRDPYVPAIIMNVPETITNTDQPTIRRQRVVGFALPSLQLSYSHMQPMGWKDSKVPKREPVRYTIPLNTGIALARMYAVKQTAKLQPSQVVQWVKVLSIKCFDPRNARTKTYFVET